MRVLIVGEGPHERGGALEALVRRLRSDTENISIDTQPLCRSDIHATHGKGRGFFKKAIRWLGEAKKTGYDALVLVVDEDGINERRAEISQAQVYPEPSLPRALGVAIRSFDAWILADETSLSSVLGRTIQRQQSPEALGDPKEICADLLSGSPVEMKPRDFYAAVAGAANLDVVVERCPNGFDEFAQRVRAM